MQIRPITTQNNQSRYSPQQNKSFEHMTFGQVTNNITRKIVLGRLTSIQKAGKGYEGVSMDTFKQWAKQAVRNTKKIKKEYGKNDAIRITLTIPPEDIGIKQNVDLKATMRVIKPKSEVSAQLRQSINYEKPLFSSIQEIITDFLS